MAAEQIEPETCASCGQAAQGYARGREGQRLCHTDDRDCYRSYVVKLAYASAEHGVVPDEREHGPGSWPLTGPADLPPKGEGCER
jgi:hypothetical protein